MWAFPSPVLQMPLIMTNGRPVPWRRGQPRRQQTGRPLCKPAAGTHAWAAHVAYKDAAQVEANGQPIRAKTQPKSSAVTDFWSREPRTLAW